MSVCVCVRVQEEERERESALATSKRGREDEQKSPSSAAASRRMINEPVRERQRGFFILPGRSISMFGVFRGVERAYREAV